jgi:LPXTG-motif cell wall-anchored protein
VISCVVRSSSHRSLLSRLCWSAPPRPGQPKDLPVQDADCSGVTVTASGMPANQQLFLLVRNLANGAVVGGKPTPVKSDGAGTVRAHLAKNLSGVATVDVSIWTKEGETLTMSARDTARTGCAPASATSGTLALTGPAGTVELSLGVLLLVGAAALWLSRRRPRHAHL